MSRFLVYRTSFCEKVKVMRPLAEQGYSYAQFYLALAYEEEYRQNKNADRRYADDCLHEAVSFMEKSMKQGNPQATYNLGCYYYDGELTQQDKCKAYDCWSLAAFQKQAGHARAWAAYGAGYILGDNPVDKDEKDKYKKAIICLEKACGYDEIVKAAINLAWCYESGGYGLDRNPEKAMFWLFVVANSSVKPPNLESLFNLASYYINGEVIAKSCESLGWAYRWLEEIREIYPNNPNTTDAINTQKAISQYRPQMVRYPVNP